MSMELHFNICGLESSALLNADIPDLKEKINQEISAHLSYSCCFWADHISSVPSDKASMEKVKEVVEEQLLYWLEVMSLLNEMNRVAPTLNMLLEWLKVCAIEYLGRILLSNPAAYK